MYQYYNFIIVLLYYILLKLIKHSYIGVLHIVINVPVIRLISEMTVDEEMSIVPWKLRLD